MHDPSKRTFRFSLRALMVFFSMLALALGYWANGGLKQRRIAAALVSSGAQITNIMAGPGIGLLNPDEQKKCEYAYTLGTACSAWPK